MLRDEKEKGIKKKDRKKVCFSEPEKNRVVEQTGY